MIAQLVHIVQILTPAAFVVGGLRLVDEAVCSNKKFAMPTFFVAGMMLLFAFANLFMNAMK